MNIQISIPDHEDVNNDVLVKVMDGKEVIEERLLQSGGHKSTVIHALGEDHLKLVVEAVPKEKS